MNQILFYGGFGLSGMMFILSVLLWKRCHIWKTWQDVMTYRNQKLGVSKKGKGNGNEMETNVSAMPTPVIPTTLLTDISLDQQLETTLLPTQGNGWDIIDEILLIHTNEL